jgi:hypothetical protein
MDKSNNMIQIVDIRDDWDIVSENKLWTAKINQLIGKNSLYFDDTDEFMKDSAKQMFERCDCIVLVLNNRDSFEDQMVWYNCSFGKKRTKIHTKLLILLSDSKHVNMYGKMLSESIEIQHVVSVHTKQANAIDYACGLIDDFVSN